MKRLITIWNRKEVCITRDLNRMNAVRDILSEHGIDYITRTNSTSDPGRHHAVPNVNVDYAYEYRIYVHKNDYEAAKNWLAVVN